MKRTGMILMAACVAVAGWSAIAWADVKAGVEAYNAGDYKRAIDEWMPAAAKNDPTALYNLGQVYRLGKGVEPDFAVAEDYYKRAAALGHVAAEGNLAALYLDADGSLFDPTQGVEWLRKAAHHGNMLSRYMLGVTYFNGQFIAMDYVEAYAWISLAAQQGLPDAVKAEQTIVSQMSLQQIEKAKERAVVLDQETGEIIPVKATQEPAEAPVAETPEAPAEPAREAAVDQKTGAWIDPDQAAQEPKPAPAPTPAPARPAPPENATTGGFGIQIASLRSEESAQAAWTSLVAAHPDLLGGLSPLIQRADLGEKGVYYRLQAGSLQSLGAARDLCAKLKEMKVGCLPISR